MQFKFNAPNLNTVAVIGSLLKQLKVKANLSIIKKNIEDHPDPMGIIAISDCLTAYNVENNTYAVKPDDYPVNYSFPL